MSKQFHDIKKRVAELAKLRDRTGKESLTTIERIQLLNEIYDGALYWLQQAVISGVTKGTGAATLVLERARMEIFELERAGQNTLSQHNETYYGINFSLPKYNESIDTDNN